MFNSSGALRYSIKENYGYRLIVEVEQDIVNYYYSLLPKYLYVQRQLYPAHISVVRKEQIRCANLWERVRDETEGECVVFAYSGLVWHDETYFWIDVASSRLNEIRAKLELPTREGFHLTIGNCKIKKS